MKTEQSIEAFLLRMEGLSFDQIAKAQGTTRITAARRAEGGERLLRALQSATRSMPEKVAITLEMKKTLDETVGMNGANDWKFSQRHGGIDTTSVDAYVSDILAPPQTRAAETKPAPAPAPSVDAIGTRLDRLEKTLANLQERFPR